MIRIGIDVQIADVSQTGIGTFTARVASVLSRIDTAAMYVPLRPSGRGTRDFSMPERVYWDQVTLPRLAAREHVDVLLKPAFSCPIRSACPTVVCLHDLIARLFPEQLNRPSAWYYGQFAPWTLRFAARIIASSEHTAADARRLLRLPEERMRVVLQGFEPHHVEDSEAGRILERYKLPKRFILHVGTIEPRKNLAFLVRVFSAFHARHPEYALVLAGKNGWRSSDVFETVTQLHLEDAVKFLGTVPSDELAPLNRAACVLVLPTLYEGFGLSPLEAMAVGTPVVAADTSSVPEVVGDAGILVSGYDEQRWVEALESAAEDSTLRSRLRSAGIARSRTFTWDRAAREIADILHEVAHG